MSTLHSGILHLYHEAPYVPAAYDSDTRYAEALDLFIGRPWTMVDEPYPTSTSNLRRLYEEMCSDPGIIYGFVYSNDALVYLYASGTVQVEPLNSSHRDIYATYPCIIPHEIFRIGEPYEVLERLDTYAVVPRAFTTFGHKLYFPESKLYFIGDHYSSEG